MPDWAQLADGLAAELQGYEPHSVVDAISAYEQYGRPRLVERIAEGRRSSVEVDADRQLLGAD
jgi:hypothetical protein